MKNVEIGEYLTFHFILLYDYLFTLAIIILYHFPNKFRYQLTFLIICLLLFFSLLMSFIESQVQHQYFFLLLVYLKGIV